MSNIDEAKKSSSNYVKYRLKNATVWSGEHGYTFSLFMDDEINSSEYATDIVKYNQLKTYLKNQLESNKQRFEKQVDIVKNYLNLGSKILDVGCGGGLFLSKVSENGYRAEGVELEQMRRKYCIEKGLKVYNDDVTQSCFIADKLDMFDAVCYWDVIEHVNYPSKHLCAASSILKKKGFIFIDTPAKDTFYHKVGNFFYRVTKGKFNLFLDVMYSEHPFGHKQIFSSSELIRELEHAGFKIVKVELFHELSFPYEFYLRKIFRNNTAVKFMLPIVSTFFKVFPIKNKVLLVGQKI